MAANGAVFSKAGWQRANYCSGLRLQRPVFLLAETPGQWRSPAFLTTPFTPGGAP